MGRLISQHSSDFRLHEANISKMPGFDVFFLLEFRKRTARSHGIKKNGNCKRKNRVQKLANCTQRDLAGILDVNGRHSMLSYVISLPVSVLRSLDTKANQFYDRSNRLYYAALLTRCYTQHALRPVIDSKINYVRHIIKIPLINKWIYFINLPSTFRDKSVQSAVPNYFKNCEVPIICYNIINLLGALYLISIKLFLILISKFVPLTPATVRTLNMFIRLRVMLLRAS